VAKVVKILDANLHVCLQWNETCQPVTLSGYAAWPKVADTVIEALRILCQKEESQSFRFERDNGKRKGVIGGQEKRSAD
jgi:hypothetical protein